MTDFQKKIITKQDFQKVMNKRSTILLYFTSKKIDSGMHF